MVTAEMTDLCKDAVIWTAPRGMVLGSGGLDEPGHDALYVIKAWLLQVAAIML
jgi:hypothetical protein